MTKDKEKPKKAADKGMPNMEINLRSRALGIHFDSQNLHLVGVRNQINQLQYKGWETLPLFESRSDEEIQDFLEEFQAKCRIKRADAFMLLPRSKVICQIVDFPAEAANNLEEAMEYQLGNYFAIDPDEYNFFPQIVSRGEQLKVMIVAIRKEHLGHTFGFIRRWAPKLAGLSLDTFGLVNGLMRLDQERFSQGQTLIFRACPDGLEMIGLRDGGIVLSHYFQIERIETALEPLPPEDDDLDQSDDSDDTDQGDLDIDEDQDLEPATISVLNLDKLVASVEAGFSSARMEPNEVDTYLWVGSDHEDVRNYLALEAEIPFATVLDSKGQVIDEGALTGFGAAVCSVHDKVAFGLNMIPEKQRKRHKRLPIILGISVAVIIVLFAVFSEAKEYQQLSSVKSGLEVKYKNIQKQMGAVAEARARLESKTVEQQLYKPFRGRKILPKLLESLAAQLPEDTYLTNMVVKETEITFQGESDQPFELQKILSNIPFLTDVKSSDAVTTGRNKDGKRRFMYKAQLVPEAFL